MSSKDQKPQHRKELHFALVSIIFIIIIFAGIKFNEAVTLADVVGINNLQETMFTLFEDGFERFGILTVFFYGFLPITLMKLSMTGIVVRILDLGASPLFLVLFFSLGRLVGQAILYTVGRFIYRIFKGKDRELATADHFLHKYKYVVYVLAPIFGSIEDLVMLVSGHERIGFLKIAPLLYIGNVISSSIWIYWTVASINIPDLFN